MQEKKADNKINESKIEIDKIDNKIAVSKEAIKNLDYIEDCLISLNKNLSTCIELLGTSMKSKKSNAILSRSDETRMTSIKKSLSTIEQSREIEKNKIKKYNEEREKLENQLKEQAKKEDNKESEDTEE